MQLTKRNEKGEVVKVDFPAGLITEFVPPSLFETRKKEHARWISEQQDAFVKLLTKNPNDTEISMWSRNVEAANAYLAYFDQVKAGNSDAVISQSHIDQIDDQLTDTEKAIPNNGGRLVWAATVVYLKHPFVEYLRRKASGIKRNDEEQAEAITKDDDFQKDFDDLEQYTREIALGESYKPALSAEENLQAGNFGGEAGKAILHLETELKPELETKLAQLLAN